MPEQIHAYGDSGFIFDTPQKMLQKEGQAIPSIASFSREHFEGMMRLYIGALASYNQAERLVRPTALARYGSERDGYGEFLTRCSPFRADSTDALCGHLQDLMNVLSAMAPGLYAFGDVSACLNEVDRFREALRPDEQTRRLLLVLCVLFNLQPKQLPEDYICALQPTEAEEKADDSWWKKELVLDWCSVPRGETFCKPLINGRNANRKLQVRIHLPQKDRCFSVTLPPQGRVWVLMVGDAPTCVLPASIYCRNPVSGEVCALGPDGENRINDLGLTQVSLLGGIGATTKKPRYLRRNGSIELSDQRLQSFVGSEAAYSGLFCADLAFVAVKKAGGIVTNIACLNQPGVRLLALAMEAWAPGEERMGFLYARDAELYVQLIGAPANAATREEVAERLIGMFVGP